MQVNLIFGQYAYACIRENGVAHDIRLEPGRSAAQSLREFAESVRQKAASDLVRAERAERAALVLESRK